MYVRKGDPINPDYKQFFKFSQTPFSNPSDSRALHYYNNGQINEMDVAILKFVYENRIVTLDQFQRLFPDVYITQITDRLNKLLSTHFLNVFMLGDGNPEKQFQNDALAFYVLDFSSPALLYHLTNDEDMQNWSSTLNVMSAGKVIKATMLTDFYLTIQQKLKHKPLAYNCYRVFNSGKLKMIPRAELILNDNGKKKNFLIDIVDENDIYLGDKEKFREKLMRYETFYSKDAWDKYYDCTGNPEALPVLIIVCDTVNTAVAINKMMMDLEIPNYRLTTLKLAQTDLETCLMKYDEKKGSLVRIKNKLFEESK